MLQFSSALLLLSCLTFAIVLGQVNKSERKLPGSAEENDSLASSASRESGESSAKKLLVSNQLEQIEALAKYNDTCDYNSVTEDLCSGNTTLLICSPENRCDCFSYKKFLTYPDAEDEESLEKEEQAIVEKLDTEWNDLSERCEGLEGSICSAGEQNSNEESLAIVPFCKAGLVCTPDSSLILDVLSTAGRCK